MFPDHPTSLAWEGGYRTIYTYTLSCYTAIYFVIVHFFLDSVILNTFLVSPSSTSVDEGEALQLFCIHGGSLPAAEITWTLDGTAIVSSSRISIQSLELSGTDPPQTSSSLYISSAEPSDGGGYLCEARNSLLPDTVVTSNEGSVTVIGEEPYNCFLHSMPSKPSSSPLLLHSLSPIISCTGEPRPPTITADPSDTVVAPGSTAMFTCSASGQPSPMITWYYDGTLLAPGDQVSIASSGGSSTLSVEGVGEEEEEGEYHCQAQNSQGTVESQTAQLHLACELGCRSVYGV